MIEGVVGDIGGTNARFAIAQHDGNRVSLRHARTLRGADHDGMFSALKDYLASLDGPAPEQGVFAVAGPVREQAIRFTNSGWAFSAKELADCFGFRRVQLVNDFTANALAVQVLGPEDLAHLGGPEQPLAGAQAVCGVCGPGSGFGVSAIVRGQALQAEGGHIAFAPNDEVEDRILAFLRPRYGRVSVERLLSGPGLSDLDSFFAAEAGEQRKLEPAEVTRRALAQEDAIAVQALVRFVEILGSVAGDLALAFGAESGMYIAGGIAPKILDVIRASRFRPRFEDKGRLSYFVQPIPTFAVMRGDLAMVGCGAALENG